MNRLRFLKTALLAPFALKGVTALRASPASSQDLLNVVDQPVRHPLLGRVQKRTVGPLITREYVNLTIDPHGGDEQLITWQCHCPDGSFDLFKVIRDAFHKPTHPWSACRVVTTPRGARAIGLESFRLDWHLPRPSMQLSPRFPNLEVEPKVTAIPVTVQYREVTYS